MKNLLTETELAYKYRNQEPTKGFMATSRQINFIAFLMNQLNWGMEEREAYCKKMGIRLNTLTKKKASIIIKDLQIKLKGAK